MRGQGSTPWASAVTDPEVVEGPGCEPGFRRFESARSPSRSPSLERTTALRSGDFGSPVFGCSHPFEGGGPDSVTLSRECGGTHDDLLNREAMFESSARR